MKNIFSSGFNLPPGCTVSDIDKAAGEVEPRECDTPGCSNAIEDEDETLCPTCLKAREEENIVPMPAPDCNTHGTLFDGESYIISWRIIENDVEICDVTKEDGTCIHPTDELMAHALREIQAGIVEFKQTNF